MNNTTFVDCGNGVRLERGVRCRMSDGVELVSDHYLPPEACPHPTLLMRQPYGRDIASTVVCAHPVWFARNGYNVVIQDVRGRGDSEGEFYPFRNEARDGAETIAWLRARLEANGRVGMYGFSYQGITQLLAAAERPEGLVCIAPGMTACDLYHGWFYHNGALRLASSLGWGLQMLKADTRRKHLREASDKLEHAWANLAAQTSMLPFRSHPALHGEGVPQYVLDWFDHTEHGEYWASMDLSGLEVNKPEVSRSLNRIAVPALHFSGWYDTYLKGSIDGFLALCNHAGSVFARQHQYLVAGPWIHIPWGDRVGAANFGDEALLNTDSLLLRWFNHWLKDSGEFADEPRIRHFVLGENRWRESGSFPTNADYGLYLHSAGKANSRKGDGLLSTMPAESAELCDVFVYDPEVPVLAPGGPAAQSGQFDQGALELGNNVLVYTTVPLASPLRIFGAPRIVIYSATSSAHTDLAAKLVRVRPNGAAEFICIGIARSTWLFRETAYAADTIHRWEFDLDPTSCAFAVGDCVRLEVASTAFPLYDRNPGSGVPSRLATSWDWRRSTQIVYHDRDHSSVLYLPLCEGEKHEREKHEAEA
ncbi:MAG: CocE/NonD family hydrolase [Candidatus Sulfotelmatobacter sp.]|jgi:putative CocE/NonD family hydrolase